MFCFAIWNKLIFEIKPYLLIEKKSTAYYIIINKPGSLFFFGLVNKLHLKFSFIKDQDY